MERVAAAVMPRSVNATLGRAMDAGTRILGVGRWKLGTSMEGEPIPFVLSAAINDYVTVTLSIGLVSHSSDTYALAGVTAESQSQLLPLVLRPLRAEGPVLCNAAAESNDPAHFDDVSALTNTARDYLDRLVNAINGPEVEHTV